MRQWYDVHLDGVAFAVADNTHWAAHWFEQESAEFAKQARRSLGQKFRRLRETLIAEMWEADDPGGEHRHGYAGPPGKDCPECGKRLEHDAGESWCSCGYACMEDW